MVYSTDSLSELSCTDITCSWKKLHKTALEKYDPVPITPHNCFPEDAEQQISPGAEISQSDYRALVKSRLNKSAFNKVL